MNPFLDNNEFDNGVEVPLIVLKLYSMLDPALKSRWCGSETATGDDSFFAWLNAPADADTQGRDDHLPVITNLAHHIYDERPDLQTVFPDLFGEDRHQFAHWFITHAPTEYALDKVFLEPTYSGWWNASRPSKDNECEEPLKIFVVGTPKAGNTWMTYLLSTIYDLPPVTLPTIFDATVTGQAGTSWVVLQHYRLEPDILAWAKQHRALFVTMMRHPGDVLVSLWHMMRNKSHDPDADLRFVQFLMRDDNQMDEHTVHYVKEHFNEIVQLSLDWANSGVSFIVRYEDLWRDPVTTLARLTNSIRPVSSDRIASAIDLCDINMLRKLRDDPQGKFFRKGGPGSWRRELPDNVVDVFRHHKPYPTLFQHLGYTLDPHDPLIDALAKPRVSTNPFVDKSRFDSGIEVPTIVIKHYLMLDPALKSRWRGSETATSGDSFFAWLNAPVDVDVRRRDNAPTITNLGHYIYTRRPDLGTAFPDLFGEDRHRFVHWFITRAQTEYALDDAFLEPVRNSIRIISPDVLDAGNIIPAFVFLLRRKLSSLLEKVRAWRDRTG
ncbi:MAG: sulfotransferase domain-containing protein [Chloroflexi bacterium]|nr:sulfotransferase domain-containing protein [Chloroflexota bacterium]